MGSLVQTLNALADQTSRNENDEEEKEREKKSTHKLTAMLMPTSKNSGDSTLKKDKLYIQTIPNGVECVRSLFVQAQKPFQQNSKILVHLVFFLDVSR